MRIALWIVQVLIGLAFVGAGFMKVSTPYAELATQMAWVSAVPAGLVLFIGVAEIAGGLGVILPAATRIQPYLTPLAAAGLVLIMLFAAIFHLIRGEFGGIIPNIILMALAGFVAYGRYKLAPIASR